MSTKWVKQLQRAMNENESYVSWYLPRDLNTVVFSLWAGFVPLITSPSSANTCAWKQDPQSFVFHTFSAKGANSTWLRKPQWQTDPGEDDITRLCHCSVSAVYIHHRLLHQLVIQLPPVWPTRAHSWSAAGAAGGMLSTQITHFLPNDVCVFIISSHLPHGLPVWPTDQRAPALYILLPSLWRLLPSPPPPLRHMLWQDHWPSAWTSPLPRSCGSTHAPVARSQGRCNRLCCWMSGRFYRYEKYISFTRPRAFCTCLNENISVKML